MTLEDIVKGIFGRLRPFSRGYTDKHDGWDIPAPVGTEVRAIRDGTVSYARDARTEADKGAGGWAMGGGKVVNIDIGGQKNVQYAHLDRFIVREGQKVKKGDLIGYVGKTGGTTASGAYGGPGAEFVGSHLHFGVWDKSINKMVDPVKALGTYSGDKTETIVGNQIDMSPDDPFTTIAKAVGGIGDLATKLVAYMLAVVLIITGLWLYSKSGGSIPQPEGVMP